MKKSLKQIISVMLCGLLMISLFAVMSTQVALADNFVPSIGMKDIEVEPVKDKDPNIVAEIVKKDEENPEGKVEKDVEDIYVVLTSFTESQKEDSETPAEIKKRLEDAKKEIEDVDALGELNEELEEIAKEYGEEFNSTIFVVSDLFYLNLSNEFADKEKFESDDTLFFKITVNVEGSIGKKPVIVIKTEDGKYEIVNPDNVNFDSNGKLIIDFDKLGTVAVLKVNTDNFNKDYNPSTGCGCNCDYWWILLIIILIILAIIVFTIIRIRLSKKDKADTKKAEDKK